MPIIIRNRKTDSNCPHLKLVFRCRARADVFGRLDHEVLHPAVERQPSRPTEPPRLVELGLLGERVVAQVDGLGLVRARVRARVRVRVRVRVKG